MRGKRRLKLFNFIKWGGAFLLLLFLLEGCSVHQPTSYTVIWIVPYSSTALIFKDSMNFKGASKKETLRACINYLESSFVPTIRANLKKHYPKLGFIGFDPYFNANTFGCIKNSNIPHRSENKYFYIKMRNPFMLIRGYKNKSDCITKYGISNCFMLYDGYAVNDHTMAELLVNTFDYLVIIGKPLRWGK